MLVLAVGGGDDLRKVLLLHLQNVLEEGEVRLVGTVGLIGLVKVSNPGATTTSAELGNRQGLRQTEHVLGIQIGLSAVIS